MLLNRVFSNGHPQKITTSKRYYCSCVTINLNKDYGIQLEWRYYGMKYKSLKLKLIYVNISTL